MVVGASEVLPIYTNGGGRGEVAMLKGRGCTTSVGVVLTWKLEV